MRALRGLGVKFRRSAEKSEAGQVTIMMGAMMLTFIFFFAFAVNTGMLVNAKINLQNAADLAAYTGAGVQARQLNQISYLNYEMRRAYKKFLFRYYVMGNGAQKNFPNAQGQAMLWSPDGTVNYGVPMVCVTLNPQDNPCQIAKLPKIEAPKMAAFDSMSQATAQVMKKIEGYRQTNCRELGKANMILLHLWLWNTDPDFKYFQDVVSGESNSIKQAIAVIKGLGQGLGLVPREAILRQRIQVLSSYVNTAPEKGLNVKRIETIQKLPPAQLPQHERKIQAFLSAYYTLGNHIFPSSNIQMDELIPENDRILALKDIKTKFDAYSIDFDSGNQADTASDCKPIGVWDGLKEDFTVGVYKDPEVLTYYAVRLKAKAHILFSPVGDIELTAYSAAMPFGSRIGPQLDGSSFVMPARPNMDINQTFIAGAIPNLPVSAADAPIPAAGQGWDRQAEVKKQFDALKTATQNVVITTSSLAAAYYHAMAPNPFEAGKYNIPLDTTPGDRFERFYDTTGNYVMWAPVVSGTAGGQADLQSLLSSFLPSASAGAGRQQVAQDEMSQKAQEAFSVYLKRLADNDGETPELPYGDHPHYKETQNLAHIVSPLPPPNNALGSAAANVSAGGVNYRTSWNDLKDADQQGSGRIGYSVKFVSFEWLHKNAANPIPAPDPDLEADLFYLKH